jgi:hypothetical protein
MHGPLICYECRIFLKEDEEHEKEQQAYEDRRQAKYKAQLEGDTVVKTNKEEATQAKTDPYDGQIERSPSPPRDLPQNYTRVTLEQVFLLGLQDNNVIKTTRKDGQVPHLRTQPIPIHLNRFARLHEIQDPSPVPRWTPRTLQFHIAYLQQRKATRNKTSARGISQLNPINKEDKHDLNISLPEKTTRLQYRQLATTITIPTPTQNGKPKIATLVGGRTATTRMDTQRTMEEHQVSLEEPITLRAGQRVIVNGQHFTLRGIPTIVSYIA